jgi:hypothetical protein
MAPLSLSVPYWEKLGIFDAGSCNLRDWAWPPLPSIGKIVKKPS